MVYAGAGATERALGKAEELLRLVEAADVALAQASDADMHTHHDLYEHIQQLKGVASPTAIAKAIEALGEMHRRLTIEADSKLLTAPTTREGLRAALEANDQFGQIEALMLCHACLHVIECDDAPPLLTHRACTFATDHTSAHSFHSLSGVCALRAEALWCSVLWHALMSCGVL